MRYALVGFGRMGRAIDAQAATRGHERVAVLDSTTGGGLGHPAFDRRALHSADVAFEFTVPDAAEPNVTALLEAGIPVVCGTTGWQPSPAVAEAATRSGVGVVIAPNFSVGMLLFARLVRAAGAWFAGVGLHRPDVLEVHHTGKKDAPSGTARMLAELLLAADPRLARVQVGNPSGTLAPDALHVASLRAGSEPGLHEVGFDGEHDRITLTHRARGREGFALGAVLAAEWIRGRPGVHGFDEVVETLVERGSGGGTAPEGG